MKKLFLSLFIVLSLSACGDKTAKEAKDSNKPVIKIGVVLPLTGDGATIGVALKAGISAAIEDKAKGTLKYDYKTIFEDNQQSPAKSATAANKLIMMDKVDAMFSFTSGAGRVIAPLVENAKLLQLCATLEDENATPIGNTTFFQGPTTQSYERLFMKALQKEKVKKIALLGANIGVACAGTEHLADFLKNKGFETKSECFNPSDLDFRFAIQKYISEGFENFYLQFFPPQTDIVLRELKKQNIEPNPIFGSGMDSGSNMDLFENLNHLGGSSGTPEFVERLKQEYHVDNNYMAAPAYDLISLAIDAFENVEDCFGNPGEEARYLVPEFLPFGQLQELQIAELRHIRDPLLS